MKNLGYFLSALIASIPSFVHAGQSELAQTIMDAGVSGSENRKTSVLVDGCEVETFVFEPFADQGLVLHSRFVFDLSFIDIVMLDKKKLEYFASFNASSLIEEGAIFNFRTIEPYMARHQMPNYRIRKNKQGEDKTVRTPSERKGADGYHFIENHDFVFIMDNLPSLEQARVFVNGLRQYQKEYCRPTS